MWTIRHLTYVGENGRGVDFRDRDAPQLTLSVSGLSCQAIANGSQMA
jgi:hypothetical protein